MAPNDRQAARVNDTGSDSRSIILYGTNFFPFLNQSGMNSALDEKEIRMDPSVT